LLKVYVAAILSKNDFLPLLKRPAGMNIEVHEIAKRIVPVLKSRGVVEASVFGSLARGEASPLSDIDLLVKYRDDVSLLDVVGLENELESILGVRVDLVSKDYLKPRLKERVLNESHRIL
jgi:hypothetical protein